MDPKAITPQKAGILSRGTTFIQMYLLIFAATLVFGLVFFLTNIAGNVHVCLVCMFFLLGTLFWVLATPIIAVAWFVITRKWDDAEERQRNARKKGVPAKKLWGLPHFALLIVLFIVSMALAIICVAIGTYVSWVFLILSAPLIIFAITLPALIWVSFIYARDRYEPEPKRYVLGALFWGMMSTLPAFFINSTMGAGIGGLVAILVAPPVEEFYKSFGLLFVRKQVDNELDGMIYGISFGVGFSVIENLLYAYNAYMDGGVASFAFLTVYRSLFSLTLHVMGPVMVGFLYGLAVRKGWPGWARFGMVALGLLFGILMHGTWNTLSTIGSLNGIMCLLSQAGLMAMVVIVEIPVLLVLLYFAIKADRRMFRDRT